MRLTSTKSIDPIRRSFSVIPTSPCPKKDPSGISQLAPGDTLLTNTVSPRTIVSKTVLLITAISSNQRFQPLSHLKVVLSEKETRNQFPQSCSETPKKNQHLTDTICTASMNIQGVLQGAKPLDWAGSTTKRTISNTERMPTPSSTLLAIPLPSTKVNLT